MRYYDAKGKYPKKLTDLYNTEVKPHNTTGNWTMSGNFIRILNYIYCDMNDIGTQTADKPNFDISQKDYRFLTDMRPYFSTLGEPIVKTYDLFLATLYEQYFHNQIGIDCDLPFNFFDILDEIIDCFLETIY